MRFFLLLTCLQVLASARADDAVRFTKLPDTMHQTLPDGVTLVDASGKDNGVRFIDINGDTHLDIVFSNAERYGIYLFNPEEKKGLQWFKGWTYVLREGRAGDANALPVIAGTDARFVNKELITGEKHVSFSELLRMPGPAPKSPEDSLRALHVKPGYEVKLVAHEPLVQDPVFVDWDAKGRMWVVEMGDYPFAPGETTKDGKVGQGKVSDLQQGRIRILEDTNGDGVMDKSTLFLDGLHHPTGLAMWKGGVFVSAIPDIFYAEDTDGDGKCDKREVWFSGFTAGNPQHLVNGFCWGLDGWYHGANGDSGGKIKAVKTGKEYDLSANDFRFDPKTGEFALEAGRSQYGKWRDDYGNWFGNNNVFWAWHYWLPLDYLKRNPNAAVRTLRAETNTDKTIHPVSQALRRFNQQSSAGTLTSGCSPIPARSSFFGHNAMFICEPANNLVHIEEIDYSQPIIRTRAMDTKAEFLASEDNWFRPSMARVGPDDALYVVDMYRLVLEHPEWIPAEIVKALNVRAGEERGRIYRIKAVSAASSMSERGIASWNAWQRDAAHRMMLENPAGADISLLRKLTKSGSAAVKIQALWVLAQLKQLDEQLLKDSMLDMEDAVRANAVRIAEEHGIVKITLSLADAPGPATALQLAFSSSALPKGEADTLRTLLSASYAGNDAVKTALTIASGVAFREATAASPALPVIINNNPDRQKVVSQYVSVSKLTGDAKRGHLLYTAVCAACHKLKGEGNDLAPDLGTVANKPVDQLIESILDPNRAVEQRYVTHSLKLKDGTQKAGLIIEENPNNLTLRTAVGVELVLLKDIASRESTNRTLMPDGLESVLKPQDIADILAWMK